MIKKVLFVFSLAIVMGGCGNQKETETQDADNDDKLEQTSGQEAVGSEDEQAEKCTQDYSRAMLGDLSKDDLNKIRRSIAESVNMTDVFHFQNGGWEDSIDPAAFKVMERMMQCSFNYSGRHVYAHEWASQDTVTKVFRDYLKRKGKTLPAADSVRFRMVFDDIYNVLGHYGAGTQADMNTVAFVLMNEACYETIGAYKDLSTLTDDKQLKRALFNDYIEWIDLFASVNERHQDRYSMYPMEINYFGSEMMKLRRDLLREEMELLRSRRPCQWDSVKHPIDWEAEDADLLRPWYDERLRWCERLGNHPYAGSFRLMTYKVAHLFLKQTFSIVTSF